MKSIVLSTFLLLAGIFSAAAGIMDWDFFFEAKRAKSFIKMFGRKGSRIFYIVLGLLIGTLGLLGVLGIVDMSD